MDTINEAKDAWPDDAPHFNDVDHDVAQPPQGPSASWRTNTWKP